MVVVMTRRQRRRQRVAFWTDTWPAWTDHLYDVVKIDRILCFVFGHLPIYSFYPGAGPEDDQCAWYQKPMPGQATRHPA